jgi:pimeloyl-ACP methyl ester carboxylesterase
MAAKESGASPTCLSGHFLYYLAWDVAVCALAGWLIGTPTAPYYVSLVVGLSLFLLLRVLPPFGPSELLAAEARILEACPGACHDWTTYETAGGVSWSVHSINMLSKWRKGDSSSSAAAAGARSRASQPLPQLPTVVVLHGHSTGSAHWEVMLRELGPHTDVWILDLPGWGRSPAPPELLAAPSHPSCASRVVALHTDMLEGWLRSKGLGWAGTPGGGRPLVLLGHSMGGHIAANFIAAHPTAAVKVLLASPVGYLPMQPGGRTWRSSAVFYCLPPQRTIRLFGRWFTTAMTALLRFVYPEDNPLFAPYYMQLAWGTWGTGASDLVYSAIFQLRGGGRAIWSRPFLPLLLQPGSLAREVPVAIIWGTGEELMLPVWGALIHRLRPGTDLYLIKDGKHNSAHSHPELFTAAALHALRREGWLKRQAGGAEEEPLPQHLHRGTLEHQAAASRHGTADGLLRVLEGTSACTEEWEGEEEGGGSDGEGASGGRYRALPGEGAVGGAAAGAFPPPLGDSATVAAGSTSIASSRSSSSGSGGGGGSFLRRGKEGKGRTRSSSPTPSPLASSRGGAAGQHQHQHLQHHLQHLQQQSSTSLPPSSPSSIGNCAGCGCRVAFQKSYWQCGCGAWSYANCFLPGDFTGWGECAAMLGFLDELYLAHPHPFNALTSAHISTAHKVTPRGAFNVAEAHALAASAREEGGRAAAGRVGGRRGRGEAPAGASTSAPGASAAAALAAASSSRAPTSSALGLCVSRHVAPFSPALTTPSFRGKVYVIG